MVIDTSWALVLLHILQEEEGFVRYISVARRPGQRAYYNNTRSGKFLDFELVTTVAIHRYIDDMIKEEAIPPR